MFSATGGDLALDRLGRLLPWYLLQIAFLQLVGEIIARTPAQRHDGPSGILATGVDKGAAIDDEQILYVVRLLKLVQHRSLGIATHARGAHLMDGPAFSEHATADVYDLEARRFKHFLCGFLHVLGHAVLVVAEFVMKTQRRDAPLVFDDRIEVDIILVAGENFAKRPH